MNFKKTFCKPYEFKYPLFAGQCRDDNAKPEIMQKRFLLFKTWKQCRGSNVNKEYDLWNKSNQRQ